MCGQGIIALTTALLDNGVFAYDRAALQNGMPWWFDEEDNGAGSALSAPATASDTQLAVVHPGRFHVGDLVENENELMQVTAVGATHLSVPRALSGTRAAAHDAGPVVATPQQVQQGLGYLGQPTDAPYPIASSATNLLSNGSFDAGTLAPWTLALSPTVSATVGLDPSTFVDGASSAAITVTSTNLWFQGAELNQGPLALSGKPAFM